MIRWSAILFFILAFAVNGWAMGAGEPQQPSDPLPDQQQERTWEPPDRDPQQPSPRQKYWDPQQQERMDGQEGNQTGTE
jgi:hypothetical protein